MISLGLGLFVLVVVVVVLDYCFPRLFRAARKPPIDPLWQEKLEAAARRDCEPHRATVLLPLSTLGVTLGAFSPCSPLFGVPGLVVGLLCYRLAVHDLVQMEQGERDPRGFTATQLVVEQGRMAVLLSVPWLIIWGVVLGIVLWQS